MASGGTCARRAFLLVLALSLSPRVPAAADGSVIVLETAPTVGVGEAEESTKTPSCAPAELVQEELPGPGIERLVDRVQRRVREAGDLEARFIQRRLTRFGSVIVERRGKLYIRSPGHMRWEYEQPPDLFVTAGAEAYFFLADDNTVQIFQTEASEASETPIMYLAGKGDLLRDFDIEETDWGPKLSPGNIQLHLHPRRDDASFSRLVLEVEPMGATIERLVQVDRVNSTIDYQFHDLEYDVGLPESLFEFEIPPGAEIVRIGG